MRVVTVVGTRPEFIKARPVTLALEAAGIHEVLVHTGQHHDEAMSQIFLEELGIDSPDVQLPPASGSPAAQLPVMLAGLSKVIIASAPDAIVVYGDTTSTLAGTLAAVTADIPLVHVEAGLRSWDRRMPEERTRVLADHAASLLLCPSAVAVENLAAEGITGTKVVVVGDVNRDALDLFRPRARRGIALERPYGLVTLHRPSNVDDASRLRSIMRGLEASQMHFVWPVHPRVLKSLQLEDADVPPNVRCINPLGFLEFLGLLEDATMVVTDSGGVQKEAYWMRRRCITVRDQTEWTETLAFGWNVLASEDPGEIEAAVAGAAMAEPAEHPELYGDGKAAARVAACILQGHGSGLAG